MLKRPAGTGIGPIVDDEDEENRGADIDTSDVTAWNDDAIMQAFDHAVRTYRRKGEAPTALEENALLLEAIATNGNEYPLSSSSSSSSSSSYAGGGAGGRRTEVAESPMPGSWETVPPPTAANASVGVTPSGRLPSAGASSASSLPTEPSAWPRPWRVNIS